MDAIERLRNRATAPALSQDDIDAATRQIEATLLASSRYLVEPNFTSFHPDDLEQLFDLYDERFFGGLCREALGTAPLRFRISSRMTRVGGTTTRIGPADGSGLKRFEIAVSSTLLYATFRDDPRPITVTGRVCNNRLEALQRIIEHELIHLVEMLVWVDSNCAAQRFQSMAAGHFGHSDHRHALVTPKERAYYEYGVRVGSRVRFRVDGVEYAGIVNRITRRATVLVESDQGEPYSDGRRYAAWYVPLGILEPAG